MYQTCNKLMHTNPGQVQLTDQSARNAQRAKLTRANFTLGSSPSFYATSSKSAFYPMLSQANSVDQLQPKKQVNPRRSNLSALLNEGRDLSADKFEYGTVPSKGKTELTRVKSMIENLKKENFKLGHQNTSYSRTNQIYGTSTQQPKKEILLWAGQRTNFRLGTDNSPQTSDYQNRFSQTVNKNREGPMTDRESPDEQRKRNMAKLNSDSVKLANSEYFDATVSSKVQFQDVSKTGRNLNQGLDPLTLKNIQGSHFKPGYGGFEGKSEQARSFQHTNRTETSNSMSPERRKFMKESHFDIVDKKQPMMQFTSMKAAFDQKDMQGKAKINEGNVAYHQRHKIHDHGKAGPSNNIYVTEKQTRYHWVQPRQRDDGTTTSMGLLKHEKQKL